LKRPAQHETDASGSRLLREVFEGFGWAVNKIEHDYGIDFDVQIFRDHEATGEWFKIQLKSSEEPSYSAGGTFISQQLDLPHAKHFAVEICEPVFIVLADVQSRRVFWHAPQLDVALKQAVGRATLAAGLTVRVPVANELPGDLPGFLTALQQIRIVLGAVSVMRVPVGDFVSAVVNQGDRDKCINDFQEKIDGLKFGKLQGLFVSGKLDEAEKLASQIVGNEDSSIESRFSAILFEERIHLRQYRGTDLPQSEFHRIPLITALRLRSVTRHGPPALKFYSLIAMKAAELELLTFRDVGLFMNWRVHVERADPVMAIGSYIELAESAHLVTKKYNQCLRLARYAARSPHLWALASALARIVQGLALFFIHLERTGQPGVVDAYFNSVLGLCRLAAQAAEWNAEESTELASVITAAMLLFRTKPKEVEEFTHAFLKRIQDPELKKTMEEIVDRNRRRAGGEHLPGDIPATAAQAVQNMATAIGINLLDPADPAAALVRLGIEDADPGRALAHCERTFISVGPPPSQLHAHLSRLLKLPSIGSKVLHCDLHEYAVEGPSLDEVLKLFKSKYCQNCRDRCPRPADWQYSDDWQMAENARHHEYMARYVKRRW